MCISLIQEARRRGASDLHLTVDGVPMARLAGRLLPLATTPVTASQLRELVMLPPGYSASMKPRLCILLLWRTP